MAEQESLLRRDGGASWAVAMMSRKMTHYLLESVAPLLKQALPLPTAALALEVIETGSRGGYDDHLTALMAAVLSPDTDRIGEMVRQAVDDSFALRDRVRLHIRTALLAAAGDPEGAPAEPTPPRRGRGAGVPGLTFPDMIDDAGDVERCETCNGVLDKFCFRVVLFDDGSCVRHCGEHLGESLPLRKGA
jgi:hypothetical protein